MEFHDNIAGCRKAENDVYLKTLKTHTRRAELLNLCSNQLYFAIEDLAKCRDIYKDHEIAIHSLCVKTFRTLCAGYKLLITGYYYDTFVLLRTCFESMLQMKYFSENSDEIDAWLKGNKIFFGEMEKELKFEKFKTYWKYLCKFVHQDYEAVCYNSYKSQIEGKVRFLTAPIYDSELFLYTYEYMLLVFAHFFEVLSFFSRW